MFCGVYYRLINLLSFCYKLCVFSSVLCTRSPKTWLSVPTCDTILCLKLKIKDICFSILVNWVGKLIALVSPSAPGGNPLKPSQPQLGFHRLPWTLKNKKKNKKTKQNKKTKKTPSSPCFLGIRTLDSELFQFKSLFNSQPSESLFSQLVHPNLIVHFYPTLSNSQLSHLSQRCTSLPAISHLRVSH